MYLSVLNDHTAYFNIHTNYLCLPRPNGPRLRLSRVLTMQDEPRIRENYCPSYLSIYRKFSCFRRIRMFSRVPAPELQPGFEACSGSIGPCYPIQLFKQINKQASKQTNNMYGDMYVLAHSRLIDPSSAESKLGLHAPRNATSSLPYIHRSNLRIANVSGGWMRRVLGLIHSIDLNQSFLQRARSRCWRWCCGRSHGPVQH
jgi:hypothetical protein